MIAQLANHQIETFLLPIDGWDYSHLTSARLNTLFNPSERERFQRFRPQSKKNEFIASRLLLRFLLARYTDCNIDQTEAIPDELGKPFWYENDVPVDLYFSLSHTKNLICCTISKCRETGCDIESLERRKYQGDLTERVMSKEELSVYHQLPAEKQSLFFFRSWTLKEAYVKAVGQGMRISFTSLSFTSQAIHQETFTVAPEQLGRDDKRVFTVMSKLPINGYCLGVTTSIKEPEINLKFLRLTGSDINFSSRP